MNIHIKDLEQADSDAFAHLFVQLSRETNYTLMTESESIALGETQHERTQQLVLADNQKVLLAMQEGDLVGFLGLTQGTFTRNQHSAALMIGVLADYWGQGIAGQLMTQALDWAQTRGIRRIEVGVADANERAIALYQRFGFTQEGVRKGVFLIDGRLVDEMMMARLS